MLITINALVTSLGMICILGAAWAPTQKDRNHFAAVALVCMFVSPLMLIPFVP